MPPLMFGNETGENLSARRPTQLLAQYTGGNGVKTLHHFISSDGELFLESKERLTPLQMRHLQMDKEETVMKIHRNFIERISQILVEDRY